MISFDPIVLSSLLIFFRWAVVKSEAVARKMVKFMEITTIGVSKEAQLRAANILEIISLSCSQSDNKPRELENFFEHSHRLMAERWKKLRDVIKNNHLFHVPKFPIQYCNFTKDHKEAYPGKLLLYYIHRCSVNDIIGVPCFKES